MYEIFLVNRNYEEEIWFFITSISFSRIQPFICEDSDQLLEFMRSSEPDEDIPEPPEDEEENDEVRFRRRFWS